MKTKNSRRIEGQRDKLLDMACLTSTSAIVSIESAILKRDDTRTNEVATRLLDNELRNSWGRILDFLQHFQIVVASTFFHAVSAIYKALKMLRLYIFAEEMSLL